MGQARDPGERRSSVVYLETAPRAAFEVGEESARAVESAR